MVERQTMARGVRLGIWFAGLLGGKGATRKEKGSGRRVRHGYNSLGAESLHKDGNGILARR